MAVQQSMLHYIYIKVQTHVRCCMICNDAEHTVKCNAEHTVKI